MVRYQPGTGQLVVFATAQGMASDECNAQGAYTDPVDGLLLISGVAGLQRVYPGQVPGPNAALPRLLLTSLTRSVPRPRPAAPARCYRATACPALRLAPNVPLVDLHLALTNTLDPSRARYAYRVRGWLADRWLGLGTDPQLRL